MEASSVLRAGLPFPESAARRHREKWTCIKEKNRKKITNMIPAREEIEKERALSRGSSRFLSRCRPIFERCFVLRPRGKRTARDAKLSSEWATVGEKSHAASRDRKSVV